MLTRAEQQRVRAWAASVKDTDVDYIQDPATGRFQGSHPHGGGSDKPPPQGELFPELPPLPPAKGKIEVDDFVKDKVAIDNHTRLSAEKTKKFLDRWNESVREAPAEFRKEFLGGLNGTMKIDYNDLEDTFELNGDLLDDTGNHTIGKYTRTIDFPQSKAVSDYFNLSRTGRSIGKTMLASNVRMYEKLGLTEVEVHANIDVGGYAWAKYGYVPTEDSWDSLRYTLKDAINELSGGDTERTPESWDELSSSQQDDVFNQYRESVRDEFYDSEVENWREEGGDLHAAKNALADEFDTWNRKWAERALATTHVQAEGKPIVNVETLIPAKKILDATTVEYSDTSQRGREDPTITIDPKETPELSDEARSQVEAALVVAFNNEADERRVDIEVPDYVGDSVDEHISDTFHSLRDRDKFRWAEDNDALPTTVTSEGTGEIDESDADHLRELTESDDPKAIWAIADLEYGKKLLLGTDWNGYLDLRDKEMMARFNAYVGQKAKTASTKS